MTTSPAHVARGTASDSLLGQVNIRVTAKDLDLQPPGGDPISAVVTPRFRDKIQQIKEVHWAHVDELHEATERLREAARHYGWTEEEIDESFKAHDESVGPILNR